MRLAVTVARDVFQSLYGNTSNNTHVGAQISILVAIQDFCKPAVKEQLTSLVIYSDDDLLMQDGIQLVSLLQSLVTLVSGVGVSQLHNLIEALAKLATRPGSRESLPRPRLLEIARDVYANAPSGYMVSNYGKANEGDDYNNVESMTADPHGSHDQVGYFPTDGTVSVKLMQLSFFPPAHRIISSTLLVHRGLKFQFCHLLLLICMPNLCSLILKNCAVDQGSNRLSPPKTVGFCESY
ncbi:hypothetical protein MKW92_024477 [Papaver armeniacum]|nr:hypothetical protein MKW92_024477 [Papaver armeniacum]